MAVLRKLVRGPRGQKFGHAMGRLGRSFLAGLLARILPAPSAPVDEGLGDVEKILVVRPNFRIGNTLMTNALVPALRARFPDARIDYLVGDTTVALVNNLSIDRVHAMSRGYVTRPWAFVQLFLGLRGERYDLAVEAGLGSFSGGLYSYLSGARIRAGFAGAGEAFLNLRLPRPPRGHAYDEAADLGRALGLDVERRPHYRVGDPEREEAGEILVRCEGESRQLGDLRLGIFVGGHLHKRWPEDRWAGVLQELDLAGLPFVVFLGPEEADRQSFFEKAAGIGSRVLPPQKLGVFAALLERCTLLVTPDSGPMHLAAALGVPTIAILHGETARYYAPDGSLDRSLIDPDVGGVMEVIGAHPSVAPALAGAARTGAST